MGKRKLQHAGAVQSNLRNISDLKVFNKLAACTERPGERGVIVVEKV